MIQAEELRPGNLVLWNPKLLHPDNTLPPVQLEVFSILEDKISYVYPNIENRVEPFEDDRVQMGTQYKLLEELEPILLTTEIIENTGFIKKEDLSGAPYFEINSLQLRQKEDYFQRISVREGDTTAFDKPVKYFHQLQNLYFAVIGEELEIKLHGQQS
jgi:hypothetical protein